jgi:2-aminoadipate transaminase
MIYSIPNFSNPTGTSMTVAERTEVVRSAVRSGIPTVEDDPYGELRYEGEAIPSLLELAADLEGPIIHLRTFSKTLAPGFRVGWVVGPRKLISKLAQAKQSVDLNTSALCQYAVLELARRSDYFRAIVTAREAYRKKRDTLLSELQGQLGNAAGWTFPTGGYFVLLSLAEGRSGEELAMRALEHGVGVVPGVNFFVTGGTNTVRLSFSHIAHHSIAEGVARLAKTVRSMSHAEAPQVQNKSAR